MPGSIPQTYFLSCCFSWYLPLPPWAVILLGAKVYQNTASRMESNYTVRTALAYVTEKIRHADESGAISPGELDGFPPSSFPRKLRGLPTGPISIFRMEL